MTVASRVLSARQVETRRRLLEAGVRLASRRRLDDFTMRDVAREADVAPATAYTYFASKEHLLAEAYAGFVTTLSDRLGARPPTGATPRSRVASVIRRATRGVAESPELARAFTLAVASSDPSVAQVRPIVQGAFREWLAVALGDFDWPDRESVVRTLELVLFAAMIAHAHGHLDVDGLRAVLDDAARLLLPPGA